MSLHLTLYKIVFSVQHISPLSLFYSILDLQPHLLLLFPLSCCSSQNCFLFKIMLCFFRSPCLYTYAIFCTMPLALPIPCCLPPPHQMNMFYYKVQFRCHFLSNHPNPPQAQLICCFLVKGTQIYLFIIR